MRKGARPKLLGGPYQAPALRVGERASCLFRDCDVVVTSWTDAPISWPRCRRSEGRGHPSLLVDDELARAIRTESAKALRYWWGAPVALVWRWRKAFGIPRGGTEGSRQLIRAASSKGADALRGKPLPPEQVERRRRSAVEMGMGARLRPGYHGPWWTEEQLALLGTADDEEVAARVGRTAEAVRIRRTKLGIPIARDRRFARPFVPDYIDGWER
jgi:hypothetical protein